MTYFSTARLRRYSPGLVALAVILSLFFVARIPGVSATEKRELATSYKFTEMPIALPAGYRPTQTVRKVNPEYYRIRSWISSVGASVALNDLTGSGRPNGLCLVDTRTDQVVVTYAPTASAADRFTPFEIGRAHV